MRWESQTVERDGQGRLPGYRESVVRRFDAPEALNTRFHEVRTKSALNKVPGGARLPFNWTVNPYRGCSHSCNYCQGGETPVLMGDGTSRLLADLRVGDEIYGTVQRGAYRRFTRTTVLDHWSTVKEAYRITLADGRALIASGDHRFLSRRGWRYVAGTRHGAQRRPHLTVGTELMGIARLATPPLPTGDHRAGHLSVAQATAGGAAAPAIRPQSGRKGDRVRDVIWMDPGQDLEGRAVEHDARLDVVSIEPLGRRMRLFDITTGTGDFIANGVVSHNCFARPTHEYLDFNAREDFEREIVVKVNVPEVLRAELARPSWKGETVAMGTNTDPYQWVEGRYQLMRGIWEALRDARNPCSILTKSPLLLRDVDLMQEIADVAEITACLSVPTLEEKAWRATEPHTPSPRARLEAVRKLNEAGIPTGILIAPLMPGVNDQPEQVADIVRLATEAGATSIGGQVLFLQGAVREIFFDWLREHRPDLLHRYERLYRNRARVSDTDRREIEAAAGAPWAGRRRADRFSHRVDQRRHERAEAERRRQNEAAARRRQNGVQQALF